MTKKLPIIADFPPPVTPGEALYVPPTGTGAGRTCSNCALFLSTHREEGGTRCMIHAPDLAVAPGAVCGYHVFGLPRHHTGLDVQEFVTPELSGLVMAPEGGTRCGNCYYFAPFGEPEGSITHNGPMPGACLAVAAEIESEAGGWRPAEVDAFGCCARWSASGVGTGNE